MEALALKYLLDTHAAIWLLEGSEKLGPRAREAHKDPFDRVITATAKTHGLTLITKDRQIAQAGLVPVLW